VLFSQAEREVTVVPKAKTVDEHCGQPEGSFRRFVRESEGKTKKE